jgi:hypothetical protein
LKARTLALVSRLFLGCAFAGTESSEMAETVAGFAQSSTTNQLCVHKSDGTPVCINGDQLATLLAGTTQQSVEVSAPTISISGSSTPPSITINGDDPAIIDVGAAHSDLGAIATDDEGNSLGLRYFLNGALVSNIVIDTSEGATDTIDYVATDTWGNTSTSTRTVFIEAAAPTAASPSITASTTNASSTAQ